MSEETLEQIYSNLDNEEKTKKFNNEKKINKYDSYFEMTEKLSGQKSQFIENILVNKELISRKFYDKNKEIKYFEIFKNAKFNLLGITPNITFIHLYEPKEEKGYNENNCIGFRYYKNGSNNSNPIYFTLIKKYDSKYYILEKNESIKDINGKIFSDNELNCFSIIQNIIIQKYKNKTKYDISYGDTFPEIIGYCYGLISLNKFKQFKCIEPLIPELFNDSSLVENIPDKFEKDIAYIEPLIYDGHISIIISTEIKNLRYNITIDMSHYHINKLNINTIIFPKTIIQNNIKYPKNPIQRYSSCSL